MKSLPALRSHSDDISLHLHAQGNRLSAAAHVRVCACVGTHICVVKCCHVSLANTQTSSRMCLFAHQIDVTRLIWLKALRKCLPMRPSGVQNANSIITNICCSLHSFGFPFVKRGIDSIIIYEMCIHFIEFKVFYGNSHISVH